MTLHVPQPLCKLQQQDHAQSPAQREPLTSQLYNLSASSQGAANPHGEDTKTRPTRSPFSGVPCLVQASHTHQHRGLRSSNRFSNTSSSSKAHEGTPRTWKRRAMHHPASCPPLKVGRQTFNLPITVSHPAMGPTRHLSNVSFSTRLLQRLDRIGQRELRNKCFSGSPPAVEGSRNVPKASHHTFSL